MIYEKIIAILLCLSISVAFCGCAASGARSNDSDNSDYLSDDSTDNNEMTTDNIVNWNNVNYKVNPVLSSSENIKNVETEGKGGITCVTFSWNYVDDENGEGYKDILMMYYNASANEIANGSQSVLGSAYCQMLDDGTTQWTYYNEITRLFTRWLTMKFMMQIQAKSAIATKAERRLITTAILLIWNHSMILSRR